jgi:Collagen triple helix repeat (20 copies)
MSAENSLVQPITMTEHLLPEALRDALGQILAQERRQWRRERELIESQAQTTIANMRADITALQNKIDSLTHQKLLEITASVHERLALVKDGSRGIDGGKGDKGDKGDTGEKGEKGEKGDKGDPGIEGASGINGAQGPEGKQGIQGERGYPGVHGEKGDKGDPGEKGDKGDSGITVKGDKGDTGEKGDKGDTGQAGQDGAPGNDGAKGERGEQGPHGARGESGPQGEKGERGDKGEQGAEGQIGNPGIQGERGIKGEKGERGEKGEQGIIGPIGPPGITGEKGDKGDAGIAGERGERGLKGDQGLLPEVRIWKPETVYYACEVVTHEGTLWQAVRDTGQMPGHKDWICLALSGKDGISPVVRGTYNSVMAYSKLDIVALNGGSFISRVDNPGACPGSDWQLLTSPGKTGKPGEPGPRGEQGLKGDKGLRGDKGATIVGWEVDRSSYIAVPIMSDGGRGPNLELRSLFEQYQNENPN